MLGRVQASVLCVVLAFGFAPQAARGDPALDYLESLKGSGERYKAPSELDARYTIALYVNASGSGPWRQRMWVLHRDAIGAPWRLAMWDQEHWRKAKLPAGEAPSYSWPVSTGRYYRGDPFSGPTPTGVFALDERKWRYGRGTTGPGMIHTMYIDFHYDNGRRSGVAFHGTLPGRYRRLGSIDSHGCIRMKQKNAASLFDRITGRDKALPPDMRWGEVPRFWTSERGQNRAGYTRDGTTHPAEAVVADLGVMQASLGSISDAQPLSVLTKTGFRAIAVIFEN